jgi:hypothetical protein
MAKKNDVCIIERSHSYTRANGPTERYTEYSFARVNAATRDGTVKSVVLGVVGSGSVLDVACDRLRVMTINDATKAEAARRAGARLSWDENAFPDVATVRQLILAELAAA